MPRITPILGHGGILTELQQDLDAGNVSHAYLFVGPPHVGKTSLALWFAHQLLTKGLQGEELQQATRHIEKLIHSDLLVLDDLWVEGQQEDWNRIAESSNVRQEHRSKAPAAKTDSISIDDVRELQERLYETSLSPYRCCIITRMERMHDAAANALLKILEEPPSRVVFLLTAESEHALLPTVISRTRVLHCAPVGRKELHEVLSDVDPVDAAFIATVAQGAPGFALELKADPDLLRAERLKSEQAQRFWRDRDLGSRIALLEPLKERGPDAERFLQHMGLALRQAQSNDLPELAKAYHALCEDLSTNVHRGISIHHFARLTVSL